MHEKSAYHQMYQHHKWRYHAEIIEMFVAWLNCNFGIFLLNFHEAKILTLKDTKLQFHVRSDQNTTAGKI